MTLSQLLECDADTLSKMSDAELLKHFEQYLPHTRPERARVAKPKTQPQPTAFVSPGKKRAMEALAGMGLDMSLFQKGRKK
jgi:hypothetical protein